MRSAPLIGDLNRDPALKVMAAVDGVLARERDEFPAKQRLSHCKRPQGVPVRQHAQAGQVTGIVLHGVVGLPEEQID